MEVEVFIVEKSRIISPKKYINLNIFMIINIAMLHICKK